MKNTRYYNVFVSRIGEDYDDIKTVINYISTKNPVFFNKEILEDALISVWDLQRRINSEANISIYYTNGLVEILLGGYFETFIQYLKDIYEDQHIEINRDDLYRIISTAQIVLNMFRINNPLYPPYKSKIC